MAKRASLRADIVPVLAETFREHGFEGASLAVIERRTGFGKGSLYNAFPGGKEEMAGAVLSEIDAWFEDKVFRPLREDDDPRQAITAMFEAVDAYFRAGRRVCLVGLFALDEVRDRFPQVIGGYFAQWIAALAAALVRTGRAPDQAAALSEEVVGGLQGALVLARALNDPAAFGRTLGRLKARLEL